MINLFVEGRSTAHVAEYNLGRKLWAPVCGRNAPLITSREFSRLLKSEQRSKPLCSQCVHAMASRVTAIRTEVLDPAAAERARP